MCVGCLEMVDAAVGGVLYTRNPVDIRDDKLIINAAWGLPKSVVDGSTATDLFEVRRDGKMDIISRHIPEKANKFVCYPHEGVCRMEVAGDDAAMPSLSDTQVFALAEMGMRIDRHYGAAQDIEWAITAEDTIILPAMPPVKPDSTHRKTELRNAVPVGPFACKAAATPVPAWVSARSLSLPKRPMPCAFQKEPSWSLPQASPRWATLLDRAAAVITEQGSLAGHLANVGQGSSRYRRFSVSTML